ncbi:MAG TPA: toast rack family protein [Bryobacteraceae bacterium]|nr:toast rack family protein [Bryobacteraceae bacterium]
MRFKYLPVLGGILLQAACFVEREPTGPTKYDSFAIERDKSAQVNVNLEMGAGNLKVGTGTSKLAQAYFTYNVPSWKPVVDYSAGELTIRQPGHGRAHIGNVKSEWDLRLGRQIPVDVHVHFGAGEAQLDLGSLDLRSVSVDMGVGKMQMDLRGDPTHDYDVRINGGVGEATVHLPTKAGVYATAEGGIGEIRAVGLKKRNDHWVNDAYDTARVKVRVDVKGGIGRIELIGDAE